MKLPLTPVVAGCLLMLAAAPASAAGNEPSNSGFTFATPYSAQIYFECASGYADLVQVEGMARGRVTDLASSQFSVFNVEVSIGLTGTGLATGEAYVGSIRDAWAFADGGGLDLPKSQTRNNMTRIALVSKSGAPDANLTIRGHLTWANGQPVVEFDTEKSTCNE